MCACVCVDLPQTRSSVAERASRSHARARSHSLTLSHHLHSSSLIHCRILHSAAPSVSTSATALSQHCRRAHLVAFILLSLLESASEAGRDGSYYPIDCSRRADHRHPTVLVPTVIYTHIRQCHWPLPVVSPASSFASHSLLVPLRAFLESSQRSCEPATQQITFP
jgi:hypothetical protein